MSLKDFTSLLGAVAPFAWPVAVSALVFCFRRPIRSRIEAVTEAHLGSNVFKFGQATLDGLTIEGRAGLARGGGIDKQRVEATASWENTGNLFWLGHDLMWTMQMALRGAPKDTLAHGLKQSHYQLSHLNVKNDHAVQQLDSLRTQVNGLPEAALDRNWRNDFSGKIQAVISEVGSLAAANQPDFEKD